MRKNREFVSLRELGETTQTVRLNNDINKCENCELCCSKIFKPGFDIASRSRRQIDILFVKDFNTFDELEIGAPFTSAPGMFFRGVLNTLDKFGASIGYVSLVQCTPTDFVNGRFICKPEDEHIEACSEFIVRFLRIHKPRTIVCLGSLVSKHMPSIVARSNEDCVIRDVVHPATIIKSGGYYSHRYEGWKDELQLIFKFHSRTKNESETV